MFKIKNIVILAAGRGSRMGNLTDNTPKPLLKINEKPIIETIIEKALKITNKIIIVVGYLWEQFKYLENKYQVKIVVNENWEKGNNVLSILSVKNYLSNTLIVNGDIIIDKDINFKKYYKQNCFYVEKNSNIDEWLTIFDDKNNVINFNKEPKNQIGYYQREVTVINKKMSKLIEKEIEAFDSNEYFEFLILKCSKEFNIPIKAFEIKPYSIFDLDNKSDYIQYCQKVKDN